MRTSILVSRYILGTGNTMDIYLCVALLLLTLSTTGIQASNKTQQQGSYVKMEVDQTPPFKVIVGEQTFLHFNYSFTANDGQENVELLTVVDDKFVDSVNEGTLEITEGTSGSFVVLLEGKLPARTKMTIQIKNSTSTFDVESYSVFVQREKRVIDKMFIAVVILLVIIGNIGMGSKVDLSVVKATLKSPVAPTIGLCSQFIFMPLVAFSLAYTLPLAPGTALGFFALGCAPGGSASNMFSHFLKGNLSLSVTMTLISSVMSLGLIPFWLFTLGQLIFNKSEIHIPFLNIITSLVGIIIPLGIGLFLQKKYPKIAEFFIKLVKYIMVIFFIFVMTVGVYANIYIFYLISPEVILASALLPYVGFIFGGLISFVLRQKREDIIAISLETGIQNTGIPIILCQMSLSGPEKDTSIVSPIVSAIFTPIPVMFGILYVQYKAWRGRRKQLRDGRKVVYKGLGKDGGTELDNNAATESEEKLM